MASTFRFISCRNKKIGEEEMSINSLEADLKDLQDLRPDHRGGGTRSLTFKEGLESSESGMAYCRCTRWRWREWLKSSEREWLKSSGFGLACCRCTTRWS